jgi:Tol biopolymer transport system component
VLLGFIQDPDWSPDGEWIAFESAGQIWKVKPNGDSLTEITTNVAHKFSPVWSADGNAIAYANHSGDPRGVWVDAFPVGNARLVIPYAYDPDWLPSSAIVACAYVGTGRRQLVISDTAGIPGPPILGFADLDIADVSVSSNGTRIVFHTLQTPNRDSDIWVVNTNGSGLQRLTHDGAMEPSWSPDGSMIVYVKYSRNGVGNSGNGKLWIMNSDGSNKHQLR